MHPSPPDLPSPHDEYRQHLIPLALICVLPLFPPETRGESMAGSALLILLLCLLSWSGRLSAARALPLALGLLLYFPALLLALAPGAVVEPVSVLLLGAAVGIFSAEVDPGRRRNAALPVALALAASIVALHGLIQSLWGLDALAARIEAGELMADRQIVLERVRGGRAFSAFATPASLGGFLVVAIPVTVGAAVGRSGRLRWGLLALGLLQIAGLLASASATAAAALVAAVVLWALARRGVRRQVFASLAVGVAILGGVILIRGEQVTDMTAPGSPWRLRAGNFRIAVEMIADHPLVGVGPGGFGEVFPRYRRAGDNETQHVHNLPLELCAEWGIAGGLILSALFYYLYLGPVLRSRPRGPPWVSGAAIGLAALAIQNLADFTVLLPSLLWMSAILRGWIALPPATVRGPAPRLAAVGGLAAVVVAACLTGLAGLAWNARVDARQELAVGNGTEAARLAERSTRLAPWNPDGWLYRAQIELAEADRLGTSSETLTGALEDVRRSIALSPIRPAARMVRARLRALQGDLPGACADAAEAARLYPYRVEYARARDDLMGSLSRGQSREAAVP
jgi:hypothetical protein